MTDTPDRVHDDLGLLAAVGRLYLDALDADPDHELMTLPDAFAVSMVREAVARWESAAPPTQLCRALCDSRAGTLGVDCSCTCHTAVDRADRFRQMSRGDRRRNMCLDSQACDDDRPHRWQPVSFRFETQLLDEQGRVRIRQPDLHEGRVYVVCMACRTHTYVDTEWAGWYLGGPDYSALGMEDVAGNLPDSVPDAEAEPVP